MVPNTRGMIAVFSVLAIAAGSLTGCRKNPGTVYAETDTTDLSTDAATSLPFDTQSASQSDTQSDTSTHLNGDSSTVRCAGDWEILFENEDNGYMNLVFLAPYTDGDVMTISSDELVIIHSSSEDQISSLEDAPFDDRLELGTWRDERLFVVTGKGALYQLTNGQWQLLYERADVARAAPFEESSNSIGNCARVHTLAMHDQTLFSSGDCWREHNGEPLLDGSIMRLDGNGWQREMGIPKVSRDTRLFELEDGKIIAAIGDGELLIYTGSEWPRPAIENLNSIFSIWGMNGSDFWVAGETVYHVKDGVAELIPMQDDVVDTDVIDPRMIRDSAATSVCGTSNNDVFIQGLVLYVEWGDPNYFDAEKRFVQHFNGKEFITLEAKETFTDHPMDCIAFDSDDVFLSPNRRYRNGVLSETDAHYRGGLAGNAPEDLYAFGISSSRSGAHFDGIQWQPLEIAPTIIDFVTGQNGDVFALDVSGAIVKWVPEGLAAETPVLPAVVRAPNCQKMDNIAVSQGGKLGIACQSGIILYNHTDNWETVPPSTYRALPDICYTGETLTWMEHYPFKDPLTEMPLLIRQLKNGVGTTHKTNIKMERLTCSGSGVWMVDADANLYFFDGVQPRLLSGVPLGDSKILHFFAHEDSAFVVADYNDYQLLLTYTNNNWSSTELPFLPQLISMSPNGRIFIGDPYGIVAGMGCEN